MMDFFADNYLVIKSLHIISVIAWMAGLFYLPRLFVYHVTATPDGEFSETLKVMERRLLRAIMNPAMVASFLFGGILLSVPGVVDWSDVWIWVKLAAITGMTIFHHALGLWRKDFLADNNQKSEKFYRMANEVPTVLMIVIVFMVVMKP